MTPVLLVVDADAQARAETESALARRFGSDYSVLSADSVSAGLATLERLARAGTPVVLVAADLHLPDTGGVDFLERAHQLHRDTSRVLLVTMDRHGTRIPFTELATLQRVTALGLIDMVVVKGWVTPEEWLYPQVQEALTAWTLAHGPRHVVYRIVGDQWAPRSHQLRDLLSRNGVPFEFAAADSDRGRQLLRDFRIDAGRLPAVIHSSGRVLYDPASADVAASHGIATRPSQPVYDLVVLGAGPAGLAAAVYGASEGLRTLVIEPKAIGGQAGTSSMIRNYPGFTRGVAGAELAHRAWEQAVLFGAEFIFSQATPAIEVKLHTRVVDGRGDSRLETLTLEDTQTGRRDEVPAAAVFILIGAEPHTDWLRDSVYLDDHGFVLTGTDVPAKAWPAARAPLPFESSLPGVLAAGDVRHDSIKRVAGAVGEGAVASSSVHRYLAELAAAVPADP